MFFEEHRHIRVTANAIATVSPDCSPETLALLADMATIVEKRVKSVTNKMESRKILPIEKRLPKSGKYNKPFNSGKEFDKLQDICILYHTALNAAENELFQLSIGSNSENILPKSERLPYDNPNNRYIGVSKLFYYTMQKKITKYHKALTQAEYVLLNNKIKK